MALGTALWSHVYMYESAIVVEDPPLSIPDPNPLHLAPEPVPSTRARPTFITLSCFLGESAYHVSSVCLF